MVKDSREHWERCFNISWLGVYFGVRTFMKDLLAAPKAWVANTSSINGFHAVLGMGDGVPHTACKLHFAFGSLWDDLSRSGTIWDLEFLVN